MVWRNFARAEAAVIRYRVCDGAKGLWKSALDGLREYTFPEDSGREPSEDSTSRIGSWLTTGAGAVALGSSTVPAELLVHVVGFSITHVLDIALGQVESAHAAVVVPSILVPLALFAATFHHMAFLLLRVSAVAQSATDNAAGDGSRSTAQQATDNSTHPNSSDSFAAVSPGLGLLRQRRSGSPLFRAGGSRRPGALAGIAGDACRVEIVAVMAAASGLRHGVLHRPARSGSRHTVVLEGQLLPADVALTLGSVVDSVQLLFCPSHAVSP